MKFNRSASAGLSMMLALATFAVTLTGSALAAGKKADASTIDAALRYLERHKHDFGLTGSDIADVVVSSASTSAHNGVTHVYFQQRYRGIEVWSAIANISLKADGTVIAANSSFATNIAAAAGGNAKKEAREAAAAAAQHLNLLRPTLRSHSTHIWLTQRARSR